MTTNARAAEATNVTAVRHVALRSQPIANAARGVTEAETRLSYLELSGTM